MKILNYGSMNVDHVYEVQHIVQPGETVNARSLQLYPGGKGLNQSIAVARAGGHIFHVGVLGADGAILEQALTESGVHTDHIKRVPGSSAHTVIQVDRNGQNSILVFADENITLTDGEMDAVLSRFEAGDAVIFQNELARGPVFMEKAARRELTVIFNPSPMEESVFSFPLDRVHWFVVNEIEGGALTGEAVPERMLDAFRKKYPRAGVLLTLGCDGAWMMRGEERLFQPSFPVRAVDTTAAGDTFLGYFVTGLLRGENPQAVLERAAKASAIAVSRPGAAVSIPSLEETEVFCPPPANRS